jgi:HNH endonuclease
VKRSYDVLRELIALDTDSCIIWPMGKGNIKSHRYGVVTDPKSGKQVGVHRLAWEFANDAVIPAGLQVRHSCDVTLCVNPRHLLIGTHTDNMHDMWEHGRGWSQPNAPRVGRKGGMINGLRNIYD